MNKEQLFDRAKEESSIRFEITEDQVAFYAIWEQEELKSSVSVPKSEYENSLVFDLYNRLITQLVEKVEG